MRKWLLCLSLLMALPAWADPKLDHLLGQIHSMTANFTQVLIGNSQLQQQSNGSLAIAEPNRFRWQIHSPNQQLFVSDGKQVWNDEQDLQQVTVSPLNTSLSATPLLLLSGRVKDINAVFEVKKLSANDYQFTPKNPDDLVKSIELKFVNDLPSDLTVTNNLGMITRIHFSEVKLNPALDPALFSFTPGPNDDVIGR
jgi:outer membrane lipoprotein carrier protein